MMSYGQLFLTILPVFAMIALGTVLKRTGLLREDRQKKLAVGHHHRRKPASFPIEGKA